MKRSSTGLAVAFPALTAGPVALFISCGLRRRWRRRSPHGAAAAIATATESSELDRRAPSR